MEVGGGGGEGADQGSAKGERNTGAGAARRPSERSFVLLAAALVVI